MCIGREIGLHVVACLDCKKLVIPIEKDDSWFDHFCHCDGKKVRYEGKGQYVEWFAPGETGALIRMGES